MREVAELELLDGYDRDSKTTITMLYGNGTRSRLNLFEGKLYRDACITLIKQLNKKDSYKIKFTEEMYEKLKKSK